MVLVDYWTVLTSNQLLEFEDTFAPGVEATVMAEVADLVEAAAHHEATFVVSNEVGMGLVPAYALGLAYRNLLARSTRLWLLQRTRSSV